jgi:hypothetical protein
MRVSTANPQLAALLLAATAVFTSACGEVARTGRSPVFLQIVRLDAASGAEPAVFQNTLFSDVLTVVRGTGTQGVPTIFSDLGRVEFRVAAKNPGGLTEPSTLNAVTLSQYRVVFRRSDGRNTQGVDIPYAFDGGLTFTVPAAGTATGTFAIVRHQAKAEPPLSNMAGNGGAQLISTVAEITFYGRDQAGNDVVASGTMSVNFGDFGDPQ